MMRAETRSELWYRKAQNNLVMIGKYFEPRISVIFHFLFHRTRTDRVFLANCIRLSDFWIPYETADLSNIVFLNLLVMSTGSVCHTVQYGPRELHHASADAMVHG
jgi:hypothetical protein